MNRVVAWFLSGCLYEQRIIFFCFVQSLTQVHLNLGACSVQTSVHGVRECVGVLLKDIHTCNCAPADVST